MGSCASSCGATCPLRASAATSRASASPTRAAALPVGAARRIARLRPSAAAAAASITSSFATVVVLPVPGPPLITPSARVSAIAQASFCPALPAESSGYSRSSRARASGAAATGRVASARRRAATRPSPAQ
jgi:hypothetical protein